MAQCDCNWIARLSNKACQLRAQRLSSSDCMVAGKSSIRTFALQSINFMSGLVI
jgi:hypothetical protein